MATNTEHEISRSYGLIGTCPACRSSNTDRYDCDHDSGHYYELFTCCECGQEFTEIYKHKQTYYQEEF